MYSNFPQQQPNFRYGNQIDRKRNNPYPEALNGQRRMMITNPLYDQHIIKPPKENSTSGRIPKSLIIYSGERNRAQDTDEKVYDYTDDPAFQGYGVNNSARSLNHISASNYSVKLTNTYKNVTSMALVSATIPFKSTLINKSNNLLHFKTSDLSTDGNISKLHTVEISTGEYTFTSLIDELQNKINDVEPFNITDSNNIIITLENDDVTEYSRFYFHLPSGTSFGFELHFANHYTSADDIVNIKTIGATVTPTYDDDGNVDGVIDNRDERMKDVDEFKKNPSQLKYLDRTVGRVLGFGKRIYASYVISSGLPNAGHIAIYAPYKYDFNTDNTVVLNIREGQNSDSNSNSSVMRNAFAILPLNVTRERISNDIAFAESDRYIANSVVTIIPSCCDQYIKYFNPPLPRLDRLTITFTDVEGNLIDFNGAEHILDFRINTLNSNEKYN